MKIPTPEELGKNKAMYVSPGECFAHGAREMARVIRDRLQARADAELLDPWVRETLSDAAKAIDDALHEKGSANVPE